MFIDGQSEPSITFLISFLRRSSFRLLLVFPSSLYFRNTNNNLTAQFAVQAICLSLSLPLSPRPSSFIQYIVPGMSSFSSTGTAVGGLSWAEPKRDGHHDFTDTVLRHPASGHCLCNDRCNARPSPPPAICNGRRHHRRSRPVTAAAIAAARGPLCCGLPSHADLFFTGSQPRLMSESAASWAWRSRSRK